MKTAKELKDEAVKSATEYFGRQLNVINGMSLEIIDYMILNSSMAPYSSEVSVDSSSWNWTVTRPNLAAAVNWLKTQEFTNGSDYTQLKAEDGYHEYWVSEKYSTIYLSSHGKACKTIQVGTEMREVPIYKTVCDGDEPGTPTPEPVLDVEVLGNHSETDTGNE